MNPSNNSSKLNNKVVFPGFDGKDPYKPYVEPEVEKLSGHYMFHCEPSDLEYFDVGQIFRLETQTKYLFKVRYKAMSGHCVKGMMLAYGIGDSGFRWKGFDSTSYDKVTCHFEGRFTVPQNAVLDNENKARIRVVVVDSTGMNEFYCCDYELYQLDEEDNIVSDNLFNNADFKYGLYGWSVTGIQPEQESKTTTFTEGKKCVSLIPFDEDCFKSDFSDEFFTDGKEWANEFIKK